jgi:hypothetical protein
MSTDFSYMRIRSKPGRKKQITLRGLFISPVGS